MCNKKEKLDQALELESNLLLNHRPDLLSEWDFEKNEALGLNIYKVTRGSGKKVWWICPKCCSSYDSMINNRFKGNNCPYCRGYKVNHTNSLAALKPEVALDWDYNKNGNLTPDNVTHKSSKKVWWLCKEGHQWQMNISSKANNNICPKCSKYTLNDSNSIGIVFPHLLEQWHPTKNSNSTAYDFTIFSSKKAWWNCNLGHSWIASVSSRAIGGGGCPFCSNRKVLKSFNDMWTTNPTLAKLLSDSEDGYKYTQSSEKKVYWKCNECDLIIYKKKINQIKNYGLSCPRCSDGKSFPEKIVYSILLQLDISFEQEKSFKWSEGKRYDYYLDQYNTIIEAHGKQHYNGGFESAGGRSLEEEIENDKLKEAYARQNGIGYIVINCSVSDISFIRKEIFKSKLKQILDLDSVDWLECVKFSCTSLIKEVCNTFENSSLTQVDIGKKYKISENTVRNYLKRGSEIGWCEYVPTNGEKRVLQLTEDGKLVKEWESISSVARHLNKSVSTVSKWCSDCDSLVNGFKWIFKEDYEIKVNSDSMASFGS